MRQKSGTILKSYMGCSLPYTVESSLHVAMHTCFSPRAGVPSPAAGPSLSSNAHAEALQQSTTQAGASIPQSGKQQHGQHSGHSSSSALPLSSPPHVGVQGAVQGQASAAAAAASGNGSANVAVQHGYCQALQPLQFIEAALMQDHYFK